jgi:hypothetical protein
MKFRKKPVVIEAFRHFGEGNMPAWAYHDGRITIDPIQGTLNISTLEGEMRADIGDWVIRGVKGEVYPCKPDIFEQTYDQVA